LSIGPALDDLAGGTERLGREMLVKGFTAPSWRRSSLQLRAAFSNRSPDRVDFDEAVFAIVEVVHVTAGLLHQHALDQLALCNAIVLPDLGRRAQLFECPFELVDEELLGVAILAPPLVLRFEPLLPLIDQDDLHGALDTA
jgi:hypothetical protein